MLREPQVPGWFSRAPRATRHGGEWSLVTPLVFKTSEPANPAGGFDSHPPPPLCSIRWRRLPVRHAVTPCEAFKQAFQPRHAFAQIRNIAVKCPQERQYRDDSRQLKPGSIHARSIAVSTAGPNVRFSVERPEMACLAGVTEAGNATPPGPGTMSPGCPRRPPGYRPSRRSRRRSASART